MTLSTTETCLVTKVTVPLESKDPFGDWQAKLHAVIATFPGFISLEIFFSTEQSKWVLIQRFSNNKDTSLWQASHERQELLEELKILLGKSSLDAIEHEETEVSRLRGGITEMFVTEVTPEKENAYRKWIAKIHQVEAKFPGFRGIYVQSPTRGKSLNWITFLQFDNPKNLNLWLSSPERQEVLLESKPLIASIESHHVVSGYEGWFSSLKKGDLPPPVWKQTMLVLLVLFPIVILELRFLSPLLASLNSSIATFIGNALSVSLIAWPLMPLTIRFLGWWLEPEPYKQVQTTIIGTCVVVALYLLEIALFWRFL